MLRRDEVRGDFQTVMQQCGACGRSYKSLISLAGAAGLEPPAECQLRYWMNIASGIAGGFIMADQQRTRRRSILTGRGVNRAMIVTFLAALLT